MQKRISNIPFSGTKEQEAQLFEIIEKHKNEPGAIMPVLQEAQNVYGYLPIEVQQMVADGLGVPLSEVFGVATFYSQFSLTPKGKYNISVCLGTACYVKGSGKILEELSKELGIEAEECTEDGKFSLTACRCIGACGLAPVITMFTAAWFPRTSRAFWQSTNKAMRELSLNVMDIAQNSLSAGASLTQIVVEESSAEDTLTLKIIDNGRGMTAEQAARVTDPFFTTRTTRKVGLGVPLFKMAAEQTGGSFSIESEPGKGTTVTAVFKPSHIDMTPLGDINSTVGLLIYSNPDRDFIFRRERDGRSFALDTRELREILGEEVKLSAPEVSEWIQGYLKEQTDMIFGGAQEDENIS